MEELVAISMFSNPTHLYDYPQLQTQKHANSSTDLVVKIEKIYLQPQLV